MVRAPVSSGLCDQSQSLIRPLSRCLQATINYTKITKLILHQFIVIWSITTISALSNVSNLDTGWPSPKLNKYLNINVQSCH